MQYLHRGRCSHPIRLQWRNCASTSPTPLYIPWKTFAGLSLLTSHRIWQYIGTVSGSNRILKQDAVLTIPGRPEWPHSPGSFDGKNEDHRKQMWIAKSVLFFRCNFRRPGPGQHPLISCFLALVHRLREFEVPEARKQAAHSLVFQMFI